MHTLATKVGRREYRIPVTESNLVISWQGCQERVRLRLDWNMTLVALKESPVPAYRALYERAHQFFADIARINRGSTPVMVLMRVTRVGFVPNVNLGDFCEIRYRPYGPTCVIAERLKVGKWLLYPFT